MQGTNSTQPWREMGHRNHRVISWAESWNISRNNANNYCYITDIKMILMTNYMRNTLNNAQLFVHLYLLRIKVAGTITHKDEKLRHKENK